jgi:hypothetical protein
VRLVRINGGLFDWSKIRFESAASSSTRHNRCWVSPIRVYERVSASVSHALKKFRKQWYVEHGVFARGIRIYVSRIVRLCRINGMQTLDARFYRDEMICRARWLLSSISRIHAPIGFQNRPLRDPCATLRPSRARFLMVFTIVTTRKARDFSHDKTRRMTILRFPIRASFSGEMHVDWIVKRTISVRIGDPSW